MQAEAKQRMARKLPRRGGLARQASSARMTTQARPRDAGVKIVATGRVGGKSLDMEAIDAGLIRHPVFDNRKVWVVQRVTAYTITDAFEDKAPEARREVAAALDEVARAIDSKVRRA